MAYIGPAIRRCRTRQIDERHTDDTPSPAAPNTILGVVLTACLMILLDLSIVYTGMPEIGRTMGMSR